MHLLVFLLMQFLSRSDQAYPSDDKLLSKIQNIVLRHLYLLLGYSQSERGLYIPAQRLRTSPVFSAYLSNLPQLLDQNHLMGWVLLNTSLTLLQYCPCPFFMNTTNEQHNPTMPNYSLWSLEPHLRRCWLMSLVVLLYKYQYNQQPQCQQLQALIRIVLNTLDSQHHHCRRIPATVVMGAPPSRSRDVSQPSLGADNDHGDRINTPPLSPMYAGDCQTHQVSVSTKAGKMQVSYHQKQISCTASSMETHWEETIQCSRPTAENKHQVRKQQDSSLDADDTESELIAIPESDVSDSTLHGSAHDSFEDVDNADDNCFTFNSKNNKSLSNTINKKEVCNVDNRIVSTSCHNTKVSLDSRPTWFIGSEDDSLQSVNNKKWGVQEGVKMMVASTVLSNNLSKAPLQKRNNNNKNCSKQSSFGSTNLVGTVATIAAVSVPVAKTMTTDSHRQMKTSTLETVGQKDNISDKNKNSQYAHTTAPIYSPIPTRHCAVRDVSVTPACTPASDSTSDSSSTQQCEEMYSPAVWSDSNRNNRNNNHGLLPTPSVERLLPIGSQRSPIIRTPPKPLNDNAYIKSPDSPLSKMDIMSMGSSKECDTDNNSPDLIAGNSIESHLDFPAQERLLPVGPHSREINQLVEKVKHALGIDANLQTAVTTETIKNNNIRKTDDQPSKTIMDKCNITQHLPIGKSSDDSTLHTRALSPRRLIKQVALESPPHIPELEEHSPFYRHIHQDNNRKDTIHSQRQRMRKSGHFTISCQSLNENPRHPGSWYGPSFTTCLDIESQQTCHANIDLKQSSFRMGDECVSDRCSECGTILEEYSDEEIGLCIIILGTFIHREPALAAPMLPDILSTVSKVAINAMYPWQNETNVHLPGGAVSVAHQFLRCVLHQLAPNGVFIQMFQTRATDLARTEFFRSVSQALLDFNELNPIAPLQHLLETLNCKKTLAMDTLPVIIENMACYLDCLPVEAGLGPTSPLWSGLLGQLELFFRRMIFLLNTLEDLLPLLKIMISVLKIPGVAQFKGILDPFSKVLGHAIQTQQMEYHFLVDLCYLCNRAFTRERDKLILCRMIIFELVQALKFKTSIPDSNFLMLINLILQDSGGAVPASVVLKDTPICNLEYSHMFSTSISDCMRLHLADILEFLTDFHALNKIKSYCKGVNVGLNDDTLGGIIKSSVAQYLALEVTRSNGRDNRAVAKYFPWLCNTASLQQGAREFIECIGHIRLLSWLLLGSLTHTAMFGGVNNGSHHNTPAHCYTQPIPQESSCQIADHIQIIMAGFAEQPKASVLHMSSLFHAFILCQLWTVYLEQGLCHNLPVTEAYNITMNILFDFWAKVTPCILQLISHSKMLSEMVSMHFLYMLEALLECRSTFLCKLLPLWTPVLYSHHIQLPGHLQVRLQNCRNFPPLMNFQILSNKNKQAVNNPTLLRWLQRLQFKMGQIELQSSTATQFYSL